MECCNTYSNCHPTATADFSNESVGWEVCMPTVTDAASARWNSAQAILPQHYHEDKVSHRYFLWHTKHCSGLPFCTDEEDSQVENGSLQFTPLIPDCSTTPPFFCFRSCFQTPVLVCTQPILEHPFPDSCVSVHAAHTGASCFQTPVLVCTQLILEHPVSRLLRQCTHSL